MEILAMIGVGAFTMFLIWMLVWENPVMRPMAYDFRPIPPTKEEIFEVAQEARVNAGIPRAYTTPVQKPVEKPKPKPYSSSSSRSSSGGSSYSSRPDDSHSSYSSWGGDSSSSSSSSCSSSDSSSSSSSCD